MSSALASASSRVFADALLQPGMRLHQAILGLLARQSVGDVEGDEGQQLLVAPAEADLGGIALHGQHADDPVAAVQRHPNQQCASAPRLCTRPDASSARIRARSASRLAAAGRTR